MLFFAIEILSKYWKSKNSCIRFTNYIQFNKMHFSQENILNGVHNTLSVMEGSNKNVDSQSSVRNEFM